MLRALLKLAVLSGIVVAGGGYLAGWWDGRDVLKTGSRAVGTTGVDTVRAREIGAEVKQKTVQAAHQTRDVLTDRGVTAKIKAKMALDDHVKAFDLNVDTARGVVTVTGHVRTDAERRRALTLARETEGVSRVLDRIAVRR